MSVIEVDRYRATHRFVKAALRLEELLSADDGTLPIAAVPDLAVTARLEGIGRRRELVVAVRWEPTGVPLCAGGVRLWPPDRDVIEASGPVGTDLDIEGRCRLPAPFPLDGTTLELRLVDPTQTVFGGVPAPPQLIAQRAAGAMTPVRPASLGEDRQLPALPAGRWGQLLEALLSEDAGVTRVARLRRLVREQAERPDHELPEQVWRHLEAHTSRRDPDDGTTAVWQQAVLAHADLVWARAAYTSRADDEHVHHQIAAYEITDAYARAETLDEVLVLEEAVLRLHAAGVLSATALTELPRPELVDGQTAGVSPLEPQFVPLTVELRPADHDQRALLEVRAGGGPGLHPELAVIAHPERNRAPYLVPLASSTARYADPRRLRGAVRITTDRTQPLDYLPHPRLPVESIPRAAARQIRDSFDAADEETRAAWIELSQLPRAVQWLREVIGAGEQDLDEQP